MAREGLKQHFDLTSLAVMWLWEVVTQLRTFFALANQAETYFKNEKPDAVILIDYPGFNWHIAKRAKRCGIPVFYYSPPQVWSWKQGRVKKMRRMTDCVFSGLPFEAQWLKERGCHVEYVGHPYFDEVQNHPRQSELMDCLRSKTPFVGLLPGSRTGEVIRNFPVFWETALKIRRERPDVRFAIAAFNEKHAKWIENFIKERNEENDPNIEIFVHSTPEIIQCATCCLSVSGSVSLELLFHATPAVISYRVSRFGWIMQRLFRRVRFITLVNLLTVENPFRSFNPEYRPDSEDARIVIFPEYLTWKDRSAWIATDLLRWLNDETERPKCVRRLKTLNAEIAPPGAARNTAERILEFLMERI